ncbi:hypothetical protein LCGC14_2040520 [marine sediment metagenome]|uniref:Proliferating cell nuclear antigen PCNA N-terminal domain-containing protein n=1 Tax=marine sediment metagenome TaxID=412755 RepID=A0A0F9ES89_9ZZZZ
MSKTKPKPKKKVEEVGFTLKFDNSRILRAIVETLSSIIDETEFLITPEGFKISAMDPSRICLLQLTIAKKNFDEFECSNKCKIALNLDDFDKIMKRSSINDTIEVSYQEADQKIKIKMQRDNSTRARTFSLALLDIDTEDVPIDNLLKTEYNSEWSMDPDFFIEAIKDAEIYSEILNIKTEAEQGITFSSSGTIGEMLYDLGIEDLISADFNDISTGAYSITFLKAILKINSITEALKISLKTDHPLKMRFHLLEGGLLNYFLAPRVSEEELDEDDLIEELGEEG